MDTPEDPPAKRTVIAIDRNDHGDIRALAWKLSSKLGRRISQSEAAAIAARYAIGHLDEVTQAEQERHVS